MTVLFLKNRWFPEITSEDNLTVFLLRESEVPWMEVATEKSQSVSLWDLQAMTFYNLYHTTSWGNLLSDLHIPHEQCLIGISDAFSAFCLWVSVIFHMCSLCPQQERAYSVLHPQAWTYIYIYIQVHARRLLPSAVPWISKDCLLITDAPTSFCFFNCWPKIK